jgi:hypothetical protein
MHRKASPLLSSLSKIEAEVAEAEKTFQNLTQTLADPDLYRDKERFFEIMDAHTQAKKKVEALTAEWVRISGLVEETVEGRTAPPQTESADPATKRRSGWNG